MDFFWDYLTAVIEVAVWLFVFLLAIVFFAQPGLAYKVVGGIVIVSYAAIAVRLVLKGDETD